MFATSNYQQNGLSLNSTLLVANKCSLSQTIKKWIVVVKLIEIKFSIFLNFFDVFRSFFDVFFDVFFSMFCLSI